MPSSKESLHLSWGTQDYFRRVRFSESHFAFCGETPHPEQVGWNVLVILVRANPFLQGLRSPVMLRGQVQALNQRLKRAHAYAGNQRLRFSPIRIPSAFAGCRGCCGRCGMVRCSGSWLWRFSSVHNDYPNQSETTREELVHLLETLRWSKNLRRSQS